MITQGKRPDGTAMMPPMPYGHFARMTGDDVKAVMSGMIACCNGVMMAQTMK